MTTLYKVLDHNGSARMGVGKWPLPNGKAGEWLEVEGDLVACENGLHLCRRDGLIHWLGPAIFTVEYDGEMVESDNKIVVRRARLIEKLDTWNDRTARLFAADCAERVLHIYERDYPSDRRVRNVIEVARKVANGDLPIEELAAAGDAAWAAWDAAWAAWAAARAAAWAAGDAAGDAAWGAAWAAWDAARAAAAGDAARAAEQEWQTARLFEYLENPTP